MSDFYTDQYRPVQARPQVKKFGVENGKTGTGQEEWDLLHLCVGYYCWMYLAGSRNPHMVGVVRKGDFLQMVYDLFSNEFYDAHSQKYLEAGKQLPSTPMRELYWNRMKKMFYSKLPGGGYSAAPGKEHPDNRKSLGDHRPQAKIIFDSAVRRDPKWRRV